MPGALNGLPLEWWAPVSLPIPVTAANIALVGRELRLYGWSFLETTGAGPATVQLLDGAGIGGTDVVDISLSAGQSTRDWLGAPGIRLQTGLFLRVVTGSVQGSIWYMGLSDDEIFRLAGYQQAE